MGSLLDWVRRVIGRERAGPLLGLLVGASLIFALPAQAALAAQLTYSGRTISYTDEGGENNTLVVSKQQGTSVLIFEDPGTTITVTDPNAICSGSGTSTVSCSNDSTGAGGPAFNLIDISVGDLDDTVHNDTNIKSHIDGGTEDDVLFGGSNDDVIDGGDGDDEIHGGKGNDELNGEEGDDLIAGDEGDDVIDGGDGDDDLSGNDGDDIIDTGLGTGANPELVLGGDGDDVVFFRYDADPGTVTIKKNSLQEILVDTDDNSLRLVSSEQLHVFNETDDGEDDYVIGDLTGRPLKVLVLQSETADDANELNAGSSITVDGTSGDDKIVLNQTNVIGRILPTLTMGNGQTPWGQIVFRGPPATTPNVASITVNALEGNDNFDVDLSIPLGNEVSLNLKGGSGNNSITFSKPDNDEFTLDLSEPDEPEAGTVTAGSAFGDVSFSDVSTVSLDGKGRDIDMTLITPEDREDIVYTPGNQNGTGKVEVNSWPVDVGPDLITFTFQGVGADGELTFDNAGGDLDNLEYNGTSRNETFTLLDNGDITLTSSSHIDSVDVHTPGISDLTINAGNGNDTVDVTDGPVPFVNLEINGEDGDDRINIVGDQTAVITVNGGAPGASDTLELTDPSGDIVVDLENETVEGFGTDPISITGIEHLLINGGGNTPVLVLGTNGNDEINFTPNGSDSGKLEFVKAPGQDLKDLTLTNSSGDLEVDPGDGDDLVRTVGTSGDDTIRVEAGEPDSDHTTTQVGSRKELITLNDTTETLAVDAGPGKDTINFLAQCDIPLHLFIDGNIPGGTTVSGDRLNISAPDDNDAESRTFSGHDPSSGNVEVCRQSGADQSNVEFERIERIDTSDAGGDEGGDGDGGSGSGATQPDGVFSKLNDGTNEKPAHGKTAGENIYGSAGSGKGGQNVSGPSRGPRTSSNGGSITVPFIIENDGPSGSDSYRVVFDSEVIQKVSGNDADPGVTVKVGGKDISGNGGLIGPVDHASQIRADIKITTDGAKVGRHKLVFNIFSDNGGGDDNDNKFVDSVTVYFTVRK